MSVAIRPDGAELPARADLSVRHVVISAGYIGLATVMIWSRFAAIGESLWHDEIFTVEHYILPGPAASFGHYGPNDHMLFSVLAWLTVHLPGLSDTGYRLWSVLPFIAAVTIVTVWLHRRAGAAVAFLFAVLSTASTQLMVLSTEARGYGLAFLAMAVMTIAAYEASTQTTSAWLTLFAAAGVIGCWTLPTFVLPLIGASGVLLSQHPLRRRLLRRLAVAFLAVGGWYAIPASALITSRGQQFGVQLPWHAPLTGGATEFAAAFIPAVSAAAFIPAVIVFPVLVLGLSRARRAMPHLSTITVAQVAFTFLALTAGGSFVEERFLSYLLVPIFIIAALGLGALLAPRPGRGWIVTAAYSGSLLVIAVSVFARLSVGHAQMPEEANRGAANAVAAALTHAARPVIFNTEHPQDILYYLHGPAPVLDAPTWKLGRFICSQHLKTTGLIFVQQPFLVDLVDTSCLARRGATLHVFRQWDRGFRIFVWELPPERSSTPRAANKTTVRIGGIRRGKVVRSPLR
jgi:hypothetical protein